MFLEIAATFLVSWVLWFVISTYFSRRKMPPGPFPYPLIGNVLSMGTDVPFSLESLREKYGDIYTLTIPIGDFVIVNRGELLHEALVTKKDDFAGRPEDVFFPLSEIAEGKNITFGDYGPRLMFRRKVVASALHVFGKGIEDVEKRTSIAVDEFLNRIEAMDGKPFVPHHHITFTIISIIGEWLWSKNYKMNDPEVKKLTEFLEKYPYLIRISALKFLPFFKYLPTKFMSEFRQFLKLRDEIFPSKLNYHLETYDENIIRNITDALISSYEIEKAKNRGKDFGVIDDIRYMMIDLLFATTDTSSSILTWLFMFMVLHEDIQDKVYEELVRVVGKDRSPCLKDMPDLHYLHATICEVMRISAFFPVNIPHSAIRDSTISGYHIPKGTIVLFNYWKIHSDPRDWDEPQLFNPERFLDANDKFVGWETLSQFRPFGDGRRVCLGVTLGKMQLQIVSSKLFHRFQLKLAKGEPRPTLDGTQSVMRFPRDYNIIATNRQ